MPQWQIFSGHPVQYLQAAILTAPAIDSDRRESLWEMSELLPQGNFHMRFLKVSLYPNNRF
jgi:hypothetical protein